MKEIKKLSDLMSDFISDVGNKMKRDNKDLIIYNLWEDVKKNEKLPIESSLEDIKENFLIIKVKHPSSVQNIRMKKDKILAYFKNAKHGLKITNIKIIVESFFC